MSAGVLWADDHALVQEEMLEEGTCTQALASRKYGLYYLPLIFYNFWTIGEAAPAADKIVRTSSYDVFKISRLYYFFNLCAESDFTSEIFENLQISMNN